MVTDIPSQLVRRFVLMLTSADYDVDALSKLDPECFTVADVKAVFRFKRDWTARSICQTAVRQGFFKELAPDTYKLVYEE